MFNDIEGTTRKWEDSDLELSKFHLMMRPGILLTAIVVTALAPACAQTEVRTEFVALQPIGATQEEVSTQAATWVNSLGLVQLDPDIWRIRLNRACGEGVWEEDVALELATEFIAEDLLLSHRSPDMGDPTLLEGTQALWIMARQVCGDRFPEGTIEAGPPGFTP